MEVNARFWKEIALAITFWDLSFYAFAVVTAESGEVLGIKNYH